MKLLKKIHTALTRDKGLDFPIQGAVYSPLPPVGRAKDYGLFHAIKGGIAKTKREKGGPKSKKRLRAEKDARYFAKIQEKRYTGVTV